MPAPHATVPMPRHVAQLPTIGGMPIPYTTKFADPATGAEPQYVGTDRNGSAAERCGCVFGEGKPLLGHPCPHRQRKAMVQRRCVTCGRKIGAKTEVIFIGVATKVGDVEHPYSIEPPAHRDCAAYSVLVCPRLIAKADKVMIATCRQYHLGQMVATLQSGTSNVRHHMAPMGEKVTDGIVDLYGAIPLGGYLMPLSTWMRDYAPHPYRTA